MGVIFTSIIGQSIGFQTSNITPAAGLSSMDTHNDSGWKAKINDYWSLAVIAAGRALGQKDPDKAGIRIIDALFGAPLIALSGHGYIETWQALAQKWGGYTVAKGQKRIADASGFGVAEGITEEAVELDFGGSDHTEWGYVIGLQGGFKDSVDAVNWPVTNAPKANMGFFQLMGVAFGNTCASGGQNKRHGLEAVLNYYRQRRASNQMQDSVNYITYRFGQTVFPNCYIIGLDFQPHDIEHSVWRWELTLAIAPSFTGAKL